MGGGHAKRFWGPHEGGLIVPDSLSRNRRNGYRGSGQVSERDGSIVSTWKTEIPR